MMLTDGGVYDNRGLEALTKGDYKTLICCDAGAPFKARPKPHTDWVRQALRANSIISNQARSLRKRRLIDDFTDLDEEGKPRRFGGTYWGIATDIDDYQLANSMVKDNATTRELRNIRTRLNSFSKKEQGQLINWGYALADTALRRWVLKDSSVGPGEFPMPEKL